MVLEKTLESPLDSKEIKPVNPKRNQSEYSLEGLMLKLKLQYFGHLMRRTDSLEKTLMLGKIEGKRRRGQQRMRWLDGILDSNGHWSLNKTPMSWTQMEFKQIPGNSERQGRLAHCSPWGHRVRHNLAAQQRCHL